MIVLLGILLLVTAGAFIIMTTKKKSSKYYKMVTSKRRSVGIEIERVDHELSASEKKLFDIENMLRKQATQFKKEKRYDEAVECLKKAREAQYKTDEFWSTDTLLRIPKYLMLANRYKEAYDEALQISEFKWKVLGMIQPTEELTKAHLRYQALEIAYKAAYEMKDSQMIGFTENLLRESMQVLKRGDF